MRTARAFAIAALVVLAPGCGGEPGAGPDAAPAPDGDGGPDEGDGGLPTAGLVLDIEGGPELPAALGGTYSARATRARLELENVRVIGDAAPGDERTTEAFVLLAWPDGAGDGGGGEARRGDGDGAGEGEGDDAEVRIVFPSAPPGIYSRVLCQVTRYELSGTVELGETTAPFAIVDQPATPLSVSIDLGGVLLEANATGRIQIEVDVDEAILAPDWDQVDADGEGVLRIGSGSPQIGAVRDALLEEFEVDDGS